MQHRCTTWKKELIMRTLQISWTTPKVNCEKLEFSLSCPRSGSRLGPGNQQEIGEGLRFWQNKSRRRDLSMEQEELSWSSKGYLDWVNVVESRSQHLGEPQEWSKLTIILSISGPLGKKAKKQKALIFTNGIEIDHIPPALIRNILITGMRQGLGVACGSQSGTQQKNYLPVLEMYLIFLVQV